MLKKKQLYTVAGIFIFLIGFVPQVNAETTDLSINGNGNTSSNQINVSKSSQKNLQQNNNATVNNTVNTTQTTGNNSTSGNTNSTTNISTGSTSSQTIINT